GLNQNILLWELKSGHLQWSLLPLRSKSKEEIEADEERAKQVAILNAERERRKREAEADAATWKGKVRIGFESYGEPADLMSARLAEPAKPYQKQKASALESAPTECATGVIGAQLHAEFVQWLAHATSESLL